MRIITKSINSIKTNELRKNNNKRLTCVLDFLALALSGSSVSEAPFSLCRLALFIGEGGSSLIFCRENIVDHQGIFQCYMHTKTGLKDSIS